MGNPVGTFSEDDVKDLDDESRQLLRDAAIGEIQTNPQIREILMNDPEVLKSLTTNGKINPILRQKLTPVLNRFRGFTPG